LPYHRRSVKAPGRRVSMTKDGAIFTEAAKLGRELISLHTYAEQFRGASQGDEAPNGKATTIKGESSAPGHDPAEYAYGPAKGAITVGDGWSGPVAPEVREFHVSGLKVVQSALGYRSKKRTGRKSSRLDDMRHERWTARVSGEFFGTAMGSGRDTCHGTRAGDGSGQDRLQLLFRGQRPAATNRRRMQSLRTRPAGIVDASSESFSYALATIEAFSDILDVSFYVMG
jgi:hypothetical protein